MWSIRKPAATVPNYTYTVTTSVTDWEATDPYTKAAEVNIDRIAIMVGSKLYLHVTEDNGNHLIVRIPTVTLEDVRLKAMTYGSKLCISLEGTVMHFFGAETGLNFLTWILS